MLFLKLNNLLSIYTIKWFFSCKNNLWRMVILISIFIIIFRRSKIIIRGPFEETLNKCFQTFLSLIYLQNTVIPSPLKTTFLVFRGKLVNLALFNFNLLSIFVFKHFEFLWLYNLQYLQFIDTTKAEDITNTPYISVSTRRLCLFNCTE